MGADDRHDGNGGAGGRNALQAVDARFKLVSSASLAGLRERSLACVCSIVVDGDGRGTGFLIGDDIVLTCHHVVTDNAGALIDPNKIRCRFAFFEDNPDDPANWIGLLSDKSLAYPAFSPVAPGDKSASKLAADYSGDGETLYDYAVLKLREQVGDKSGVTALGAQFNPLGWIKATSTQPVGSSDENRSIAIVQFPKRVTPGTPGFAQEAQQSSSGRIFGVIGDGLRAQHHSSTRQGSSGSPVFDSETLSLIGMHNAGAEEHDETADNRFVPIDRIVNDIGRRAPSLLPEISLDPPNIKVRNTTTGRTAAFEEAVKGLVRAARCLLDRDVQHDSIVAAFATPGAEVYVSHIACRDDKDAATDFITRMQVSACRAEGCNLSDLLERYLNGSLAQGDPTFLPWKSDSLNWPEPNTTPEAARKLFQRGFISRQFAARTLITIFVNDTIDRIFEQEKSYMEILGAECAAYVGSNTDASRSPRRVQALVIYQVGSSDGGDASRLAPMWTDENPPAHCGASVLFDDVGVNQIETWCQRLNISWLPDNHIVIPDNFGRQARRMTEVFSLFQGTVYNAATTLVERRLAGNAR